MILPNRDNVKTVAVLHQQEASCRVVIASLRAGGGDFDIKTAETIHLGAGGAAFSALIERVGGVDAVIRVLPPGCTIARVCALPSAPESSGDASSSALADALAIMAETDLPASIPAYRRSAGMISPGRGPGKKPVGLLTAWPSNAEIDPSARTPRVAPEVGISEAAALAVLAQLVGGVDRAWTIDRPSGAMTILAAGPDKTVVRVARIPGGDPGADARRTAIIETSRAAGLTTTDANPAAAGGPEAGWLALEPAPTAPRIGGQVRSADWVGQYGLAAAAAFAFAEPNPAVSALVSLHEVEPKAKPPILQRVSELLGAPKLAAALIVLSLLIIIAVPIGVSYAKLRILEKQVKDTQKLFGDNDKDEHELAFYKLLREKRWPMTKLLADIAGCCPQGISVESVEVGQGEGIVLRGTAEDTAKLTTFRANLNSTKVFADATTPSVNPGATGVQFQLTAKVAPNMAIFPAKPIDDWAASSLSDRLYPGQHAISPTRSTSSSSRTERPDRSERTGTRTDHRTNPSTSRPSGTNSRENSRDSSSRNERTTAVPPATTPKQPVVIPPPISDAEIAKLSADEATKKFGILRKASSQTGIDEDVKRRLADETEKVKARMQEALRGGGQ